MSRLALALALLAALLPTAGADTFSFAPSEAVASASGPLAVLAWTPGDIVADSYRIYGLIPDHEPFLLLDTATTVAPVTFAASVPGGFSAYAVSGVLDGQESVLVYAISSPCDIFIETDPPNVVLRNCLPGEIISFRRPL